MYTVPQLSRFGKATVGTIRYKVPWFGPDMEWTK